jgi:hypothetical protein
VIKEGANDMSSDTIAPTKESLRHAYAYEVPERSQKTERVAYRKLTAFEALERAGRIDREHMHAARKLTMHYMGALGVRVGNGDGGHDLDGEYPEIYHGQMVRLAWRQVTRAERLALEALVQETSTLEELGRQWLGCRQRGQAHIAGMALVRGGLERLAVHWSFKAKDW